MSEMLTCGFCGSPCAYLGTLGMLEWFRCVHGRGTLVTVDEAARVAGRLSETRKMPGYSYGYPASMCKTGSKLAKVPGSVCSHCYAKKGRYPFRRVQATLKRHWRGLFRPSWVDAMVILITKYAISKSRFFRWNDSGDIQSVKHLRDIVRICERTPDIRHWLPTQEYGFVGTYLRKYGAFPENLTVRLSAHMIDSEALYTFEGTVASMVYSATPPADAHACPAHQQFNQCDECRACWSREVKLVAYPLH